MTCKQVLIIIYCWISSLVSVGSFAQLSTAKGECQNVVENGSGESDGEGCLVNDSNDNHQNLEAVRDQFNQDGYVVLEKFFPQNTTSLLGDEWYHFSLNYWSRIFQVLHSKGHISQPHHVMNDEYSKGLLRQPGYQEIVHRYPGRYELSLNDNMTAMKESDAELLYHDRPSLQPIIDQLEPLILSILRQHPRYHDNPAAADSGTSEAIDTWSATTSSNKPLYNLLQSMLISAPGSHMQKFHIDTKHLNDQEDDVDEHLTAHIINVFIPLVNITTDDLGPTELVPKSHFETRYMYNPATRHKAKMWYDMEDSVTPLMNVGDVLIFDFRTLHRGLGNIDKRNINRPLLVLAFSIPSFHDKANWPGPSIFE